MLEDARRRTLHALDGLTPSALDWLPPEGGNSIGALLYHIALIESSWVYEDVLQTWDDQLDVLCPFDDRDEDGNLTSVTGLTLDDHAGRLSDIRRLTLDAFRGMTVEDFRRPRAMPDYDVTPEWVLHHLMQHEAEHRGQIGALRERLKQR